MGPGRQIGALYRLSESLRATRPPQESPLASRQSCARDAAALHENFQTRQTSMVAILLNRFLVIKL